jgi:hypothetical protein
MTFEDARLGDWWASAFPDNDVIDRGLDAGRDYDAYLIVDQLPAGEVATVIGYNPRLSQLEQEQAALECKRRVDSFTLRGRNGPYAWQERTCDAGFQTWVGHRSPVGRTIWPHEATPGD